METNDVKPFEGFVKTLEAIEFLEQKGVRRVRTQAGVTRYKQPIGSIIIPGTGTLKNLSIYPRPRFAGFDSVKGRNGTEYAVGQAGRRGRYGAFVVRQGKKGRTPVATGGSEEEVYKSLDSLAGNGKGNMIAHTPSPGVDDLPLQRRGVAKGPEADRRRAASRREAMNRRVQADKVPNAVREAQQRPGRSTSGALVNTNLSRLSPAQLRTLLRGTESRLARQRILEELDSRDQRRK
jgi:hypothetical protein